MFSQRKSTGVVRALLASLGIGAFAMSESKMHRTADSIFSQKSSYRKRNRASVSFAQSKREAVKRRNIRARSAK